MASAQGGLATAALAVLGGGFLVGAVLNLRTGDMAEAAACAAIGAVLLCAFVVYQRDARHERDLLDWLELNAAAIRKGGADYDGFTVTMHTPVRQFGLCVSALVIAWRLPSRLLLEGKDDVRLRGIVFSVATLLLGWWSLSGLVWTPAALVRNLRGGRAGTIGDYLPKENSIFGESAYRGMGRIA